MSITDEILKKKIGSRNNFSTTTQKSNLSKIEPPIEIKIEKPLRDSLTDEEQETITKSVFNKVTDILDFVDNINRLQYFVTGGIKGFTKEYSSGKSLFDIYEKFITSPNKSEIFNEAKAGLVNKKRSSIEDSIELIYPDQVKKIRSSTNFKLFGIDSLEMDAVDIGSFFGDVILDPLTYVPFGASVKLAKNLSSNFIKSPATKAARKILGPDNFIKAEQLTSNLYDNLLSKFDLKAFLKRKGDKVYSAFSKYVDDIEISHPKAKNIIEKTFSGLNSSETNQLGEFLLDMRDVGLDIKRKIISKKINVDVNSFVKIDEQRKLYSQLFKDIPLVEKQIIAKDLGFKYSDDIATNLSSALFKNRGLKKIVNNFVKQEAKSNLDFSTSKINALIKMNSEALLKANKNISKIRKVLKDEVTLSNKIFRKELFGSVEDFGEILNNIKPVLNKNKTVMISEVLDSFGRFKNRANKIQSFVMAEIDLAGKMAKKNTIRDRISGLNEIINRNIIDIEGSFKRALSEGEDTLKIDLLKTVSKSFDSIKKSQKEIVNIVKIKKDLNLLTKSKLSLDKEIVDVFSTRVKDLIIDRDSAYKTLMSLKTQKRFLKKEISNTAKRRAIKLYSDLENTFSALEYSKIINETKNEFDNIFKKSMSSLPDKLKIAAEDFRKIVDEIGDEALSEGIISGKSIGYAKRLIQDSDDIKSVLSSATSKSNKGSSSFKKKIKFDKWRDSRDYVENVLGKKFITDAQMMLYSTIDDYNLAKAKHTLQKNLMDEYGVNSVSSIPKEIRNIMDYFFRNGEDYISNPAKNFGLKSFRKLSGYMKGGLTAINLAFYVRNILGYPFFAAKTAGLAHAANPMNYVDSINILSKSNGDKIIKSAGDGFEYTLKELTDFVSSSGYFQGGFFKGDIFKDLGKKSKSAGKSLNSYIRNVFEWAGSVEDFGRTAVLISNIRSGKWLSKLENTTKLSKKEYLELAAKYAKDAMFDYNLIWSPFDKAMQGVFGFYTFTRKNLPGEIMRVLDDPKQYAILSKVLNRVSNQDNLSNDEMRFLSNFDKQSFKIFGDLVGGIREMKTLGFTPMEEAYQTITGLTSGDFKDRVSFIAGRINPVARSFLDYWYGIDSFRGEELSNSLPEQYSQLPDSIVAILGLDRKTVPKYKNGEIIGSKDILYGSKGKIHLIKSLPISRFLSDALKFKSEKDFMSYVFGIKTKTLDINSQKYFKEKELKKKMIEKAKEKGLKILEIPYLPDGDQSKYKKIGNGNSFT